MAQQDFKPETVVDLNREVAALGLVVRKIGAVLSEYAGLPGTAQLASLSAAGQPASMPDTALAAFARKVYLARRDREKASLSP